MRPNMLEYMDIFVRVVEQNYRDALSPFMLVVVIVHKCR